MANTTHNGQDTRPRNGSGAMSVREAGRKGGEARRAQLGPDGYAALGRRGVEALRKRHGPDAMSRIGHEGGEARKQDLGPEGYAALGRKGGRRVSELVEKGRRAEGHDARHRTDTTHGETT